MVDSTHTPELVHPESRSALRNASALSPCSAPQGAPHNTRIRRSLGLFSVNSACYYRLQHHTPRPCTPGKARCPGTHTIAWIHNSYALRATEGTCTVPACITPVPHTTHQLHVPSRTPVPDKPHVHRYTPCLTRTGMPAITRCSTGPCHYSTTHPLNARSAKLAERSFACCSSKQP